MLETNLDAVCISPNATRSQYDEYVNQPTIQRLYYHSAPDQFDGSYFLSQLQQSLHHYPFDIGSNDYELLDHCRKELIRFLATCSKILQELGPWATDFFILRTIRTLKQSVDKNQGLLLNWSDEKHEVILRCMQNPPLDQHITEDTLASQKLVPSTKVDSLVEFLTTIDATSTTILIFVTQRAVAMVLSEILNRDERTKRSFKSAYIVGSSSYKDRSIHFKDLATLKSQQTVLEEFRDQRINIVVATSVLEEGIDVPACNVVICMDPPMHLKSFIQRRGRARRKDSTFVMLFPTHGGFGLVEQWQGLERDLKLAYQEQRAKAEELKSLMADEELPDRTLRVPSSGYVVLNIFWLVR